MQAIENAELFRERGGNTDPPVKKQENQCIYWCFTYNNYDKEQIETLGTLLRGESDWYLFQEETGEKTGTPHLQGTIKLKKKQRMTQLKKIDPKIRWEPTKAVVASVLYCSKKETRSGEIYHFNIEIPAINEDIDYDEPRGWQLQVMDIISVKPDKRTIHWFWEETGGVGKTTLCKYLVGNHNALMLTGKSNDMYHMISKFPNKRKLFIVDCPRSQQDYINYGAIEQIKNGLIFSGKYEGSQLIFNCPHVIVFSNSPPDLEKMSGDRWNVVMIE